VGPVPSDDELLARLGRLLAADDPVPPGVLSAAMNSHSWYGVSTSDLDAEVAALVADSLLSLESVRGTEPRLLTYRATTRMVELEVSEAEGRLRVIGQLVPPIVARVRAERPDGGVEIEAGRLGRFTFDDLPPGPTRFVCTPPGGVPVRTEWTVL
jgi:hypothetical protein